MHIKQLIDAIGAASRQERGNYHVTLSKLIAALEAADPGASVVVEPPYSVGFGSVGAPTSYRGYYSDLAFRPSDKPATVADLLDDARRALGATFDGYKGGDYTMGPDTPLWISSYGSASGLAVIATSYADAVFTLITKQIED